MHGTVSPEHADSISTAVWSPDANPPWRLPLYPAPAYLSERFIIISDDSTGAVDGRVRSGSPYSVYLLGDAA